MENFLFIENINEREMYKSAYDVITQMNMWEYLKNYEPGEHGFMFSSNDKNITNLMNTIVENYSNHSGFSMGFTMRIMQYIAKNGIDKYRKDYIKHKYE